MDLDVHHALESLQQRYRDIFATLQAGGEVAPSQRLRAEGMMETLVLLELSSDEELQDLMQGCYEQEFGISLAAQWGEDWRELFPFPQIPGFGRRAPVYPSTRD